jgi:hypothetical protein
MAIIKYAKNLSVALKKDYKLTAGKKLLKVHDALRVVAVDGNLALHCNGKIVATGNAASS